MQAITKTTYQDSGRFAVGHDRKIGLAAHVAGTIRNRGDVSRANHRVESDRQRVTNVVHHDAEQDLPSEIFFG